MSLTRRTLLKRTAAAVALASLGSACTSTTERKSVQPVPASRAEDLVQHYGLNTRFRYASTVYGYTDAVAELVSELGVRTVRERISTDLTQRGTLNLRRVMPMLASKHGIRWHATCLETADIDGDYEAAMAAIITELVSFYAPNSPGLDLANLIQGLSGPNEVNHDLNPSSTGSPWYTTGRTLQTTLWDQTRLHNNDWSAWTAANGNVIPIAGPSTRSDTTEAQMEQLGDLTAICDRANAHLYQQGATPSTGLAEKLDVVSISFDDYPCLFTEAGYNNSLQTNASLSVPEWASNIYAPKAPCDFFKRRASYFRFELMDDPDPINFASQDTINTTADIEAHYGLVAMTTESASVQDNPPDTWRKKPEFYTMRRWIALLADRDPLTFQPVAFTPAPLSYAVQGETSVQDLLVQKHDGHHFLIVWRDVDVFDPDPSVRLDLRGTIAPEPVDITLEEAATVLIYKPSTGGTAATATPIAQARVLAGQSVRLGLDYDLQILEIW